MNWKKACFSWILLAAGSLPLAGAEWSLSGRDAANCRIGKGEGERIVLDFSLGELKGKKQLLLDRKPPLEIPDGKSGVLLRVRGGGGHRLYFECRDRDGETLLYSYDGEKKFRTLAGIGMQEILLLPLSDRVDAWGGGDKANRKPDFPLRLTRLWLDPMPGGPLSGTLEFEEPRLVSAPEKETGVAAFDPVRARVELLPPGGLEGATGLAPGRVLWSRQGTGSGTVWELVLSGGGWPGIRLRPPAEYWDLSAWSALEAEVENRDPRDQVEFHMRIFSAGGEGEEQERTSYTTVAVNPGEKQTVRLFLPHAEPGFRVPFPAKFRGAPEGIDRAPNLRADRIVKLDFYTQYPHRNTGDGVVKLRITGLRPAVPYRKPAIAEKGVGAFFPFVDEYGQYIHAEWPEKIHSDADLAAKRDAEAAALKTGTRIAAWDRFGGWAAGPLLKATGFFRAEKYRGKWYLVDPEGRLFLSHGVNAVQSFDDFTTRNPEWFRGRVPENGKLDFVRANLLRKYGSPLQPAFQDRAVRRMEQWGLNTIGGWSDAGLCRTAKTPYTVVLFDRGKSPKIGGIFDPFDPAFAAALDEDMNSANFKWSLNDPWCIGYFVTNELSFGKRDDLARATLKTPPGTPAREAMTDFLRERRNGDIAALNRDWRSRYASWEEFRTAAVAPSAAGAQADLEAFSDRFTEEFFRRSREAVKKNAPNQLYLGSRFNGRCHPDRPWLFAIAARHCDVVSFNNYSNSVAQYMRSDLPDVPVIIGEFALNVRDRGMFNDYLRTSGMTQKDRTLGYLRYWQGVLAHPNLVGAHWFTWVDQPLTGRFDGENCQFGLVDVADTPYPELTRAMRLVGEQMYERRLNDSRFQPIAEE